MNSECRYLNVDIRTKFFEAYSQSCLYRVTVYILFSETRYREGN